MHACAMLGLAKYAETKANRLAQIKAITPEACIGRRATSAGLLKATDAFALLGHVCGEDVALASGLRDLTGVTPPHALSAPTRGPENWHALPMTAAEFLDDEPHNHDNTDNRGGSPEGDHHTQHSEDLSGCLWGPSACLLGLSACLTGLSGSLMGLSSGSLMGLSGSLNLQGG